MLIPIDTIQVKETPAGPLHWAKPLTLAQLKEKRLDYHKNNGCNYPMFSLAFLLDDQLKTLNKYGGGLDPKLLIANIEKTDDPLCLSQLSEAHQMELCKLMVKIE